MSKSGDERANCVLQICCAQPQATKALAAQMKDELGCSEEEAKTYAEWIHASFDLAPLGTLTAFKAEVARLAKL